MTNDIQLLQAQQERLVRSIQLLKCVDKTKPAFVFALLYNADLMSTVNPEEIELEIKDDEVVLRKKINKEMNEKLQYFYDPLILQSLSFRKINIIIATNEKEKAFITAQILSKFREVEIEPKIEVELPKWLSLPKDEIMKRIERAAMRKGCLQGGSVAVGNNRRIQG